MTIACTLSSAELQSRRFETAQLARAALRSRRPLEHGELLTFDARAEDALRELIAAEASCCPFLTLELRRAGEQLELRITGPDDALPIIAELFAG